MDEDKRISELDPSETLTGIELLAIVQDAETRQMSINDLLSFAEIDAYLRLDGSNAMLADLDAGGFDIIDLSKIIIDSKLVADLENGYFYNTAGTDITIDFKTGKYYNPNTAEIVFDMGNLLFYAPGISPSIDIGVREFYDSANMRALSYETRIGYDVDNDESINWSDVDYFKVAKSLELTDNTKGIVMTDTNGSGDRYLIRITDGAFVFDLI